MKLTNPLRHVYFGSLGVFVKGIVTYRLSPYELRAFDGLGRVPVILKRCLEGAVHTVPCNIIDTVLAICVHEYVEKKYDEMCRKKPEDYTNDK